MPFSLWSPLHRPSLVSRSLGRNSLLTGILGFSVRKIADIFGVEVFVLTQRFNHVDR